MNKLYILMACACLSCHNDIATNQNQSKQWFQHFSDTEFIGNNLDTIDWHVSAQVDSQDIFSKSIFFKAKIDFYSCTILWTSNPKVLTYFDRKHIYFLSSQLCLLRPKSLEYFDIDDYHAFIQNPLFYHGNYKNYSILKIPLKSNLECISEVSVMLIYSNHCKQNHKSEL